MGHSFLRDFYTLCTIIGHHKALQSFFSFRRSVYHSEAEAEAVHCHSILESFFFFFFLLSSVSGVNLSLVYASSVYPFNVSLQL